MVVRWQQSYRVWIKSHFVENYLLHLARSKLPKTKNGQNFGLKEGRHVVPRFAYFVREDDRWNNSPFPDKNRSRKICLLVLSTKFLDPRPSFSLVNLGACLQCVSPLQSKIFSISCSLLEMWQNHKLGPLPMRNPGSAPVSGSSTTL